MSERAQDFSGLYFDGASAGGKKVRVSLSGKALIIAADDAPHAVLARWPLKRLTHLSDGTQGSLRLGCRGAEASLEVADPAFRTALGALLPRLLSRRGFWGTIRLALILALFSSALLGAIYLGLPRAAEAFVPLISRETEARIGDGYYAELRTGYGACEPGDAAKTALTHLRDRLLGKTMALAPTVDIIEMPIENAFALPGGHVLVTKSLINAMTGPDELAGVLSHEFGHVIERHPMIAVVENYGLSTLLTIMTGGGSGSGETVINAAGFLASLSYSRRLEARADAHALILLDEAKISPKGFADLFERLEKENETKSHFGLPVFLNSHPPSPERAARARAADKPGTTPALGDADWAAIKAACNPPPKPDEKPGKAKHAEKKKHE